LAAVYQYDMADAWVFDLALKGTDAGELDVPQCMGGDGPNLIEGVGGAEGLVEVLGLVNEGDTKGLAEFFMSEGDEILSELREWLPFNHEEVNEMLVELYTGEGLSENGQA